MEIFTGSKQLEIRDSGLLVPKEDLLQPMDVAEHLRNRTFRAALCGITGSGKTTLLEILKENISGIKSERNKDNPFANIERPISLKSFMMWEFPSVDFIIKQNMDRQKIENKVREVLEKFGISRELLNDFTRIWNSMLDDSEKPSELREIIEALQEKDLVGADEMKPEAVQSWEEKKRLTLEGLSKLDDEENLDLLTLLTYNDPENQSKYDELEANASLSIVAADRDGTRQEKNRLGSSTGSLVTLDEKIFGSIAHLGTLIHLFSDDIFAAVAQANGKPVGISSEIDLIQISREDKLFLELLNRTREYVLKSHIHLIRKQDLTKGKIRDMVDFISLVVEKLSEPDKNRTEIMDCFNAMLRSDPVAEKLKQIAEKVKSSTTQKSAQA